MKERNWFVIFLLSLITLGIYSYVYAYKAYAEVCRVRGVEHQVGLFVIGIFIPTFLLGYQASEYGRFADAAKAAGSNPTSLLELYLWSTLGLLILVGPFVALAKQQNSLNRYRLATM